MSRQPCPLIVVHSTTAPPSHAHSCIAGFYVPTYKGSAERGDREQVGWKRLPIVFSGFSPEHVEQQAAQWWEAEQDREERKRAVAVEAGNRARNRRAA